MAPRRQKLSDEELIALAAQYADRRTYTAKDGDEIPDELPDVPSGTAMSSLDAGDKPDDGTAAP